MIFVAKAPYRISLLGGGSDLEWFVADHGYGVALGCAIDKYSAVVITPSQSQSKRGTLNYSSREEYIDVNSISHPLIRSALLRLGVSVPIEMASFGEASGGSGLGGSSSFLVALISALSLMQQTPISTSDAASLASMIEIKDLSKPIGRQDQYLCALGGINALRFDANIEPTRLDISQSEDVLASFCESLIIVPTGQTRSSSEVLSRLHADPKQSVSVILSLRKVAESFIEDYLFKPVNSDVIHDALENAMITAWRLKKNLPGVMNSKLTELEETLTKSGLTVLKLLGAGGGGYFLCKPTKLFSHSQITRTLDICLNPVVVSRYGCQSWTL